MAGIGEIERRVWARGGVGIVGRYDGREGGHRTRRKRAIARGLCGAFAEVAVFGPDLWFDPLRMRLIAQAPAGSGADVEVFLAEPSLAEAIDDAILIRRTARRRSLSAAAALLVEFPA